MFMYHAYYYAYRCARILGSIKLMQLIERRANAAYPIVDTHDIDDCPF